VVALSGRETDIERGDNGTLALTGAALCFAACAAVVLYGIYLVVAQLHHQTPTTGSGPQTELSALETPQTVKPASSGRSAQM
jgi:hypothetical protein